MPYRRDIDDESLFDAEEAQVRRQRRDYERAENIRRGEEQTATEDARVAMIAKRARADTERWNASALLRDYRAAGIEPPFVNAAGVPTISLALLKKMGWKIEDLGRGEKQLVAPPPEPKREVESRIPIHLRNKGEGQ